MFVLNLRVEVEKNIVRQLQICPNVDLYFMYIKRNTFCLWIHAALMISFPSCELIIIIITISLKNNSPLFVVVVL